MLAIISSVCSCKDITSCLTCSDEFKVVSMSSTWSSVSCATFLIRKKNTFIRNYILNKVIHSSRIPTNIGAQSRLGCTKIQQMYVYEKVHPNFALAPLFLRAEMECGKRLFRNGALQNRRKQETFSCCFERHLEVGSCLDHTSKYAAIKHLAVHWTPRLVLAPLLLTHITLTKAYPQVNKKQKGKTCRHRELIFFNSKFKPSTLVLRYGSAKVYLEKRLQKSKRKSRMSLSLAPKYVPPNSWNKSAVTYMALCDSASTSLACLRPSCAASNVWFTISWLTLVLRIWSVKFWICCKLTGMVMARTSSAILVASSVMLLTLAIVFIPDVTLLMASCVCLSTSVAFSCQFKCN